MWWGPGFTEWTNVTGARPLFRGHVQPKLPADLGFYDLRLPEIREKQASLARANGIEAFCYYHYWFGGGKRILDRPFTEVLASGAPDFPFCLCWANESWSGIWHGAPNRILLEQTYPEGDLDRHWEVLIRAFRDSRYLTMEGRPILFIYRPREIPEVRNFTDAMRERAQRDGLPGLFLVACASKGFEPLASGFDARMTSGLRHERRWISRREPVAWIREWWRTHPNRIRTLRYDDLVEQLLEDGDSEPDWIPLVVPNWDNTPRSGKRGFLLTGTGPEAYGRFLARAVASVQQKRPEHRIIAIKSWNEWAEGNFLEPDQRNGHQWLEATRRAVCP